MIQRIGDLEGVFFVLILLFCLYIPSFKNMSEKNPLVRAHTSQDEVIGFILSTLILPSAVPYRQFAMSGWGSFFWTKYWLLFNLKTISGL